MPRHVGRIGADASLEIGREDAGLDGHLAEQAGSTRSPVVSVASHASSARQVSTS